MAKALKTAAVVVGVAALAVAIPGVGAAIGTAVGVSAATVSAVVSVAALATSVAAQIAAKKPGGSVGGSQTAFKIDKEAGLPVAFGRTYVAGNAVHRQYYGPKNVYESWGIVSSIGPIDGYESLNIDNAVTSVSGGAVGGAYAGFMWLDEQLGAGPESGALTGPFGSFPGWDAGSKLSGLAAELWTLKFDTKGKVYPAGVPKRGRVLRGVLSYDPRLDSTYPGGSGPCRIDDHATWSFSQNPALNSLSWAYGHYQNGALVAGGGLPVTGIDLAPFVEWANICDANGWTVGGVVYTTADDKWDILKMIAQAGGGEVMPVGALLSCTFSAPRVSIGTIRSADIIGEIDAPSTAARKDRINGVIPRVRSEGHGWEVIPLDPVVVDDYVTFDGGRRTREIDYPLVQLAAGGDTTQPTELALYQILNARELDPIVLPCKLHTIDYLPGDCLTLDIPEANLVDRDVIVRNRELDMASLGVTFSCRSEDPNKHPFALGKTTTAPPTPDLQVPDPADFAVVDLARAAHAIVSQTVAYPVTSDDSSVTIVAFDGVLDDGSTISFPAGTIAGLTSSTDYGLFWQIGNEAYEIAAAPALTLSADPAYAFVGWITTSSAGVYPTSPTPPGGWRGGGRYPNLQEV